VAPRRPNKVSISPHLSALSAWHSTSNGVLGAENIPAFLQSSTATKTSDIRAQMALRRTSPLEIVVCPGKLPTHASCLGKLGLAAAYPAQCGDIDRALG
jgi:hypothetical protein